MSKWEDDFKKLTEQAEKAGPVALLPEQQKRVAECDAEITKVYAKYKCVPVVIESTTRMNGQPVMVNTQIQPMPMELMQAPPEVRQ